MNHLQQAHLLWGKKLTAGMHVIDATAGNGHDTLALANFVLTKTSGWVWAFDIQKSALLQTKLRLNKFLKPEILPRITLLHESHEIFPLSLPPIDLIVYNLGYLPGGDHNITTQTQSTLTSIKNALSILSPSGHLSITLYPGHPEGKKEKEALEDFAHSLRENYTVTSYFSYNTPTSPVLLYIQKIFSQYREK